MKKVALHQQHLDAKAKMIAFAGFEMPVSYTSINEEHIQVRNHCGVFDVSHMGEFSVKGAQAKTLLDRVCSNDISKLVPGKAQYNYLPTENGTVVDDLIVYMKAENDYFLVVNASNIEKDFAHLQRANTDIGALLENQSDQFSLLAVQGPEAAALLQEFTPIDLAQIPFYHFAEGSFGSIESVLISATGYTGAGGFELYCQNQDAALLWEMIQSKGIQPIGLAARDTLRLEMGYCLYGNDIDETTNALEAGLGWVTKFNTDFIGSQALLRTKESGLTQKLVGFKMIDKGIPRNGYVIKDGQGQTIGRVTSGTLSPSLGYGIGLGYVTLSSSQLDQEIFIEVRSKALKAVVVKLPFVN
ncbi:MAG: glycine cleavage system aminomethyltransferase GcvT [Bacteroidetes bacterium]|nr:glycine cleavage system aminomethyltransferase GcvT [Bacteroidota bacterium]